MKEPIEYLGNVTCFTTREELCTIGKQMQIDVLNELLEKVNKLDDEFPYKKRGDIDSYSEYREGHSDALGIVIGWLEFLKDKNE